MVIVCYLHLGREFRRIIGVPVNTIRLSNDILFVNNEPRDEKYLFDKINEYQEKGTNFMADYFLLKETKIPPGFYFVLGDNRPYTTDSRDYGLISESLIIRER